MAKGILSRIPYLASLRSFLEQWGLWGYLVAGASWVVAFLIPVWAWLQAVPGWAVALIALATFAALVAILYFGYGFWLKRQQAKMLERFVHIDRDQLADELEDLSRKIAALVGEFRGPLQEAWWSNAMQADHESMRTSQARIEGQLIEKYSYRHAADVWRLIRRASKVVPVDQRDVWHFQHGVRGEYDVVNIYMFLAALSDDVRAPARSLPVDDTPRATPAERGRG